MKKPIFRVFVKYLITNKGRAGRGRHGFIDTFVLTNDLKTIEQDEELINRICYLNKKKKEKVSITIKHIEIENQYGETSDRF